MVVRVTLDSAFNIKHCTPSLSGDMGLCSTSRKFLQKHTMAQRDSAYLPCMVRSVRDHQGGCCNLFRHRARIQLRKRNNWRVTRETLTQDFAAVGEKNRKHNAFAKEIKKDFKLPPEPPHRIETLFVVEWFNLLHLISMYVKQIEVKSISIDLHWNLKTSGCN